ncbi:MAG: esterase-like activity of phytase family protein [Deltaproteobacteria bacterium]|nr:esterase-like activity of phytase family protein [Deltaproteobacteria bacterium]
MQKIIALIYMTSFFALRVYADSGSIASVQRFDFPVMPRLGDTASGDALYLGGFSGLAYRGEKTKEGFPILWTHTDRGPNAEPFQPEGKTQKYRPFPLPAFQPLWVKFALDTQKGKLQILQTIPLTGPNQKPVTGMPNDPSHDEVPSDLRVQQLDYDPYGLDLEGMTFAPDGSVWMADEYRPSLVHFSKDGKLLDRFIPKASNTTQLDMGTPALSKIFASRKQNRGFEAIAISGNTVYSFLQSPLPHSKNDKRSVRVIAFDTESHKEVGQYVYILDNKKADKIGDMVHIKDKQFLVIERDGKVGPSSFKKIYRVDFANATNLLDLSNRKQKHIEKTDSEKFASKGIQPAKKTLLADVSALGIDNIEKFEGITILDDHTIALVNDNDFGLQGDFDPKTGKLAENKQPEITSLVVLTTTEALY